MRWISYLLICGSACVQICLIVCFWVFVSRCVFVFLFRVFVCLSE